MPIPLSRLIPNIPIRIPRPKAAGGAAPRQLHPQARGTHQSWELEKILRKNRNTFSTSRKIDAASRGAELRSVERRSR